MPAVHVRMVRSITTNFPDVVFFLFFFRFKVEKFNTLGEVLQKFLALPGGALG